MRRWIYTGWYTGGGGVLCAISFLGFLCPISVFALFDSCSVVYTDEIRSVDRPNRFFEPQVGLVLLGSVLWVQGRNFPLVGCFADEVLWAVASGPPTGLSTIIYRKCRHLSGCPCRLYRRRYRFTTKASLIPIRPSKRRSPPPLPEHHSMLNLPHLSYLPPFLGLSPPMIGLLPRGNERGRRFPLYRRQGENEKEIEKVALVPVQHRGIEDRRHQQKNLTIIMPGTKEVTMSWNLVPGNWRQNSRLANIGWWKLSGRGISPKLNWRNIYLLVRKWP